MAKQTESQIEAHRVAVNKYRRTKTKIFQLQYPIGKHQEIVAYAKHINMPATTWIKQLIRQAIDTDDTFVYNPDGNKEDDYED